MTRYFAPCVVTIIHLWILSSLVYYDRTTIYPNAYPWQTLGFWMIVCFSASSYYKAALGDPGFLNSCPTKDTSMTFRSVRSIDTKRKRLNYINFTETQNHFYNKVEQHHQVEGVESRFTHTVNFGSSSSSSSWEGDRECHDSGIDEYDCDVAVADADERDWAFSSPPSSSSSMSNYDSDDVTRSVYPNERRTTLRGGNCDVEMDFIGRMKQNGNTGNSYEPAVRIDIESDSYRKTRNLLRDKDHVAAIKIGNAISDDDYEEHFSFDVLTSDPLRNIGSIAKNRYKVRRGSMNNTMFRKTCNSVSEQLCITNIKRDKGASRTLEKREVVYQGSTPLRFCHKCDVYQPLRTKHCSDCQRCIRTHDHHCPWLGTCVGEKNRIWFFWFLFFQSVEMCWAFYLAVQILRTQIMTDFLSDDTPQHVIYSLVLFIFIIMVLMTLTVMVICLLIYQMFLIAANITTWENMSWKNISYLKNLPENLGSPFSRGFIANLAIFCCPPGCPVCVRRLCRRWHVSTSGSAKDMIWEAGKQHAPCLVSCLLNNACD